MTKSKAKWRAHRGVLELDALLLPYIEKRFDDLSEDRRHDFFTLLALPDPDLQSILIYSENLNPDHPLYHIIRDIKKNNQLLSE